MNHKKDIWYDFEEETLPASLSNIVIELVNIFGERSYFACKCNEFVNEFKSSMSGFIVEKGSGFGLTGEFYGCVSKDSGMFYRAVRWKYFC